MTFKPAKAIMASIAAIAALAAGVGSAVAAETSVSAADLAKSQPITVKADADISGKDFYAVQLAAYSAAQTDGTNITGYDLKSSSLRDDIDDALTDAGIDRTSSAGAAYDPDDPMPWVAANLLDSTSSPWAGKLRDFLDCLTPNVYAYSHRVELVKGADANTMTANVEPGIYAIVDVTGGWVTGMPSITMMNGTGINGMTTLKGKNGKTYKLGEVEYKVSDAPVPVKKIVEDGQSKDTNETAIGKTVNYRVTVKVPNWTGYDNYALGLYDTMGQGLTFNNDVKATVAGKTVTVKTVSDNGRILILFAPTSGNSSNIVADKANYPVGADIVVTYSATVNRNAVIGGEGNPNGIELACAAGIRFNPMSLSDSDETDGPKCGATGNTVKTYVGAFDIVKQDAKGASLEGAEFNVYEAGKTTPVKFVKTGSTYRVADKTETTGTTTTVTAGNATITGVDGAYDVVETKSPFGNAIKARFTTTVTVNQKTGEYKAALTKADANHLVASDNKFTLTVTNCRNIGDMPKTGATWLAIYTTAGLLLVAAGAAMYLRRARA